MDRSNLYNWFKARNKRKKIEKQATELAPFFLGLVLGAGLTTLYFNSLIMKLI